MTRAAAGLTALCLAMPATAREPGVPPTIPPGATMGVPIAASPPPGLYFSLRSGYSDTTLRDGQGDAMGADVRIRDTALQFLWVPGTQFWGADYKAMVLLPILDIHQTLSAPMGSGSAGKTGLGNVEIRPVDLSWQIEPGIFVNAGFSIHAPTGYWSGTAPVSTAGHFWSLAPSVGFSYLRDGWNLSAHAIYFVNGRNRDNGYRSGNEINLNLTAMKGVGDWSLGPVAYWRKQVSGDDNGGTAYGGTRFGRAEQLALGLGVTRQIGKVSANLMLTDDVVAKNTLGGQRLWVNFTLPLGQ
ncbi:transporter [Phaeovulum sp. W22_SRMD_FR3]